MRLRRSSRRKSCANCGDGECCLRGVRRILCVCVCVCVCGWAEGSACVGVVWRNEVGRDGEICVGEGILSGGGLH